MKKTSILFILAAIVACNKTTNEETKSTKILWADNVQTILPIEKDTMWEGSDFTNASNKFDREKLFSSITNAVLSGKLKAFANYPGLPLTENEVRHLLVQWDSTATVEDPNNPGVIISAPMKNEITADRISQIRFHEKIELDTLSYSISKKVSYITLLTYKFTEKGDVVGVTKLFDVKLNE